MARIELLDEQTIDKIAAGEVVERPSSAVKELAENAIDAGARAVTVEIRDGGTSLIRVTDNGSGIPADQIQLAFARHSTSKLRRVEDLAQISSLGFRGEALSSIAAVSKAELITKTPDSFTGCRYLIEGGRELLKEEVGAPNGTTIIVRDLFYNTPARKKFLKAPQTEAGYTADIVDHMALSHPGVSFKFVNNGQVKLHTPGNSRLEDVIYQIYGRDISSNLLEINADFDSFSVRGYIGKPVISRGNRSFENYFINGRFVHSSLMSKAIEDGYRGFMMQHKYPFTVLLVELDGRLVDVNVHPQKMEIRFSNGEELYARIKELISGALSERELVARVHPGEEKKTCSRPAGEKRSLPEPFETNRIAEEVKPSGKTGPQPEVREPLRFEEGPAPAAVEEEPAGKAPREDDVGRQMEIEDYTGEETRLLSAKARPLHRIIGQLFDTYWLVEFDGKLYMIDQHAAHEKVLYEEMMSAYREKEMYSQLVSPPIIVTLQAQEEALLNRYLPEFERLGFAVEPFGGRDYAVGAVPANIYGLGGQDLFEGLIDEFDGISEKEAPDIVAEKIASMACRAAVKGSKELSRPEIEALIDKLLELENPYFCPHGRPVIISMTRREIEKKFKRIV